MAGRRRDREEARRAKERMAAEVARIQAEECAKEEASRKEREEREEERKAQVARERGKERARLRGQRAREEAGRKERVEREVAEREEAEETKRRAVAAREAAEREAAEAAERRAIAAREAAEQEAAEEAERRAIAARVAAEREAAEEAERQAIAAREAAEQEAEERWAIAVRVAREEEEQRANAAQKAKEEREDANRKAREAQLQQRQAHEAQVTMQQVVLGSALVTFGAGLDFRSVVTRFDLHRVVVKELPCNANPHEVATVFTQLGVNPENVFLGETRPSGIHADAIFLVGADQVPLCGSGRTIDFQGQHLRFEVGPIAFEDSMVLSSHNTNTLTVYWRVSSTLVIATYPTLEVAKAKAKELDGKMLGGHWVRAVLNTQPPTTHGWRESNLPSVKILNLPLNVPITEVEAFSGTSSLHIVNSPIYILEGFIEFLRKHLEGLPGAIRGTFVCLSSLTLNSTIRVEIQFNSWEEAKFACDTLDNRRLQDNYPYIHAFLPRAHRFVIDIPREQYRSQKRQWDSLVQEKGKGMACIHVNERCQWDGRVVIMVEGNDLKAVGTLKVRVERLAAGERLDPSYWDRSFSANAGFMFLQQVHDTSGAYVLINQKVQTLRVYGDTEMLIKAKEMIKEEVERLALVEQVMPLKEQSAQYFLMRGLGLLREVVGSDNVSLDCTPWRFTIKGGDDAHHHLKRVMDESLLNPSSNPGHADICSLCYDTVSYPENLGCGHSYCTACLWHYLEWAANTKEFPLICMGNNATCRMPLSIPLIRKFLTAQRFNQLVEVAFLSYLGQHPREFGYCTTPDCDQIYSRDLSKPILRCPACFSTICSSCQGESHEGMTCLQWMRYNPTTEQKWFTDDWASAHSIKKCPGCGIWIEKTEGSNHLTCRCGVHLCWKCMGIFTPETIHAHTHDEPPEPVLEDRKNSQLFAAQKAEREQRERERQRQAPVLELREVQRLRVVEQAQVEAENRRRQYAESQRLREEMNVHIQEARRREEAREKEEARQKEEDRQRAEWEEARQREETRQREEARQREEVRQREERMREAQAVSERELRRQQLERQQRDQEIQRLQAVEQAQAEAEAQRQREEMNMRIQEARQREEARQKEEVRQREEACQREERLKARAVKEREFRRQRLEGQQREQEMQRLQALAQAQAEEAEARRQREQEARQTEVRQRGEWMREAREWEFRRLQLARQLQEQEEAKRASEKGASWSLTVWFFVITVGIFATKSLFNS